MQQTRSQVFTAPQSGATAPGQRRSSPERNWLASATLACTQILARADHRPLAVPAGQSEAADPGAIHRLLGSLGNAAMTPTVLLLGETEQRWPGPRQPTVRRQPVVSWRSRIGAKLAVAPGQTWSCQVRPTGPAESRQSPKPGPGGRARHPWSCLGKLPHLSPGIGAPRSSKLSHRTALVKTTDHAPPRRSLQ